MPDHRDDYQDRLKTAGEFLTRASACLARVRASTRPGVVAELRNRSQTLEEICRAAYVSIREIEWNDGIPSDAELEVLLRNHPEMFADKPGETP